MLGFAMALSLMLGEPGMKPDYIDATAHVTIRPQDGGFRITGSHLVCEARVPGIDEAAFARYAEKAKAGCPVSQALAGTEITLETKLRQD
jgi:lipoyl-dependent peroxiredoxin